MRDKFISQLANDVLKQNYHWKNQCIKIQNRLRDYESAMLQALQQSAYQQANLTLDPYEILESFCLAISKSFKSRQSVNAQNNDLMAKISHMQQRVKELQAEKEIFEGVLQQKSRQLCFVTSDSQIKLKFASERVEQLKKTRDVNILQIQELRKKNDTILNEVVSQQRQKIHDLVISHKNQLIGYRRSIQQETWRVQSQLRNEIDAKNQEIRKLIASIDRMKTSDKLYEKDWIVLENLMKPYNDHALIVEKLSELRKQVSQLKSQYRNLNTKLMQTEISKSELQNQHTKVTEEFKNMKQKLKTLNQSNEKMTQQLRQEVQDKDRLTKYYDEKWIQQFNQVKNNLQKKHNLKKTNLQREYQEKEKNIQSQISKYENQNRAFKNQINSLKDNLRELERRMETEVKVRFTLLDRISQLKRSIEETQKMSQQDLQAHLLREKVQIQYLSFEIEDLQFEIKTQKEKTDSRLIEQQTTFKTIVYETKQQKQREVEILQFNISKLQTEKKEQTVVIQQLQRNHKAWSEAAMIQFNMKMEKRLDIERDMFRKELQQQLKFHQQNEQQFSQKAREGEFRCKQIIQRQEDLKSQYKQRQIQLLETLEERERVIFDCMNQVAQVKVIKMENSKEIEMWKQKLEDSQIQIKSLNILIQSKEAQLCSLNIELRDLVKHKDNWNRLLKNTQKTFQHGFRQIKDSCDRLITFYKSRIWEMERMLERHPISQKDYQQIKMLTQQCKKLQDKVQIKEAQNLILNQVKEYYENKVTEAELSGAEHINLKNKSVFVKRPKRRLGLLSLRQTATQRSTAIFDIKQVENLKKYIRSRKKQEETSLSINKDRRHRNKSSMI